jgi:hypothetical protein
VSDDPSPLARAVVEAESHAHEAGWDRPPSLFALVPTDELLTREPGLAAHLGVDATSAAGTLTPVEQDQMPLDRPLEETLHSIMWPAEVTGCAVVLERLALPSSAEAGMPEDPLEAQAYAAQHSDRRDVRMAVGVSRDGTRHCVLRVRTHDGALIQGPDLVPELVGLLQATFED